MSKRIMAEIHVERGRGQPAVFRERYKRRHEAERARPRIEAKRDAIEIDFCKRGIEVMPGLDFHAKASCGYGFWDGQSERIGTALEVGAGYRIGGLGLRVIHALRNCPRARFLPQRRDRFAGRALIERRDVQLLERRRDQAFKRLAAERPLDERSPLRFAGGGEWIRVA